MQESLFPKDKSTETLAQVADRLVALSRELIKTTKSEEDLRIGFEKVLAPILAQIGVKSDPQYEKTVYLGGRLDALHGQVIIEYKKPGAFRSESSIHDTFAQLTNYIPAVAKKTKDELFIFDPKPVGVGFDGEQIFFVRYTGDKRKAKTELSKSDFNLVGPFTFNQFSSITLLTYLRALQRKSLNADNLVDAFGPNSKIAEQAVSAFTESLLNWGNERTEMFYNEWRRLFGIVYGEKFRTYQEKEARILRETYKIESNITFQQLLFAVHTYFALIIKLISVELISIKGEAYKSSYSLKITHANKKEFEFYLTEIEEGGIYIKQGISNFLEGDFFRWYLNALSPRLQESIRDAARALAEFEPATGNIEPETSRDLLKRLYQFLVPRQVRHKLGEYYTPDWLAELIINETNYKGNIDKRVLDPACGSGTFLVISIQLAKESGNNQKLPSVEIAKRIINNIWGFDLNPLAVIAARTNYLFALGDLIASLDEFEIPIYLADSVLWPERKGQMKINSVGGKNIEIHTSIGDFHVPYVWVKDEGFLMRIATPIIERCVRLHYSADQALKQLSQAGMVFEPNESVITNFYQELLALELEGKNGIWARFLKNAFAPLVSQKFDFVFGNPPWIRWQYLSDEYRDALAPLCAEYGIFSLKGQAARLGGGEKDFSMVFTYACIDFYLRTKGQLAFLVPQEVFKSKGAGEGFRRFRLGNRDYFRVTKAHDFVDIQPFDSATNKTAAIFIKKGERTKYPIDYYIWKKRKGIGRIKPESSLCEIQNYLNKIHNYAKPIEKFIGSWQTLRQADENFGNISGENKYQARLGARVEPYGVFLLDILQVFSNNDLLVENVFSNISKRDVFRVSARIESDLIFPIVRGADISRWGSKPRFYVLLCQDPQKRTPYPLEKMKNKWPKTYDYLTQFKDILLTRGSKTVREFAERTAFYAMFGIGPYTMANYKVVWKRMTNDLHCTVVSIIKTPYNYKKIIPTDTTSIIACEKENEAHYLCAIINSTSVRDFIKSFSSAGRGFGTPSVMKHVGIPQFDENNKLHLELSNMSIKLHALKREEKEEDIPFLEKENDKLVKSLFGIK